MTGPVAPAGITTWTAFSVVCAKCGDDWAACCGHYNHGGRNGFESLAEAQQVIGPCLSKDGLDGCDPGWEVQFHRDSDGLVRCQMCSHERQGAAAARAKQLANAALWDEWVAGVAADDPGPWALEQVLRIPLIEDGRSFAMCLMPGTRVSRTETGFTFSTYPALLPMSFGYQLGGDGGA